MTRVSFHDTGYGLLDRAVARSISPGDILYQFETLTIVIAKTSDLGRKVRFYELFSDEHLWTTNNVVCD